MVSFEINYKVVITPKKNSPQQVLSDYNKIFQKSFPILDSFFHISTHVDDLEVIFIRQQIVKQIFYTEI